MTASQGSLPVAPSFVDFKQHGESGMWVSELLPPTAEMADDICLIKSMHSILARILMCRQSPLVSGTNPIFLKDAPRIAVKCVETC